MNTDDFGGYEKYAAQYNQHLQRGELGGCGEDLFLMATCLRAERKRVDELKALMLSFYFDLNGVGSGPTVNKNTAKRAAEAMEAAGLDRYQVEQLYTDTIHKDTVQKPIMSVRDSLCIFEMCMEGQCDEAEGVLGRFLQK